MAIQQSENNITVPETVVMITMVTLKVSATGLKGGNRGGGGNGGGGGSEGGGLGGVAGSGG